MTIGGVGLAAADHGGNTAGNAEVFTVSQPNLDGSPTCYVVEPLGDGTESVEDFYDYRSSTTDPQGSFSSYGTQDLHVANESQLFFYEGTEGVSLVFIHDSFNDGVENGGTVTFNISGLPSEAYQDVTDEDALFFGVETRWAVEDDFYFQTREDVGFNNTRNDVVRHDRDAGRSHYEWVWAEDRNDGGVINGFDTSNFEAVEIEPKFNEESDSYPFNEWNDNLDNRVEGWFVRTAAEDPDSPEAVNHPLNFERNLTITPGDNCASDPPSASLSTSGITERTYEFDASGSDDDQGVVGYLWDFDGDGTVDRETNEPTVQHTYVGSGTFDPTVTVVDASGQTDTETASPIEITADTTPPSASLRVVSEGGTTVELNASNSTDNIGIDEYRWDLDGDGTVDETTETATLTTDYTSEGLFEPQVTVVDGDGNSDTALGDRAVADAPAGQELLLDRCTLVVGDGSYALEGDILDSTVLECIEIVSSDVRFDGQGHELDLDRTNGQRPDSRGVYAHGVNNNTRIGNVTVENVVTNDWQVGVHYQFLTGGEMRNVTATRSIDGTWAERASDVRIVDSVARDNALGFAHRRADGIVHRNNTAENNRWGFHFEQNVEDVLVQEAADHDVTTVGAEKEGILQKLVFGAVPEAIAGRADTTTIMVQRDVGADSRLKRLFT